MERPNRSDVHLSKEEEERIEDETREHFDELAPKRHSKPQRSEHSSNYVDVNTFSNSIPEFAEFQRLETHDHQKLDYTNGSKASEEFVETDYYSDLNCVDKQHHTTGTGFIRVEDGNENAKCYSIEPELDVLHHDSCKGNPATNDWIPSADTEIEFVSEKPGRSDN